MDATTRKLNGLREEVENLKRRNIKLEAYTRRESIKIFGIKEPAGETTEKTEEPVRTMLKEKMKIPSDSVDNIRFERVHRMATRQDRVNSTKPRATIVKFSFYQDKEYVWSFGHENNRGLQRWTCRKGLVKQTEHSFRIACLSEI